MITKQILCLHQGPMRNEIAGDPPLEVEQREVSLSAADRRLKCLRMETGAGKGD